MELGTRVLANSLSEVRKIDRYLADEWRIELPHTLSAWEERLSLELGPPLEAKYWELYDAQAGILLEGRAIPPSLETKWYDFIAQQPVLGIVHSRKRTYILDLISAVQGLVRNLNLRGALLDVGCNAGYCAEWWSRRLDITVVGVDRSERSIGIANERTASVPNCRFVAGDLEAVVREKFEIVVCADAYPASKRLRPRFMRAVADRAIDDGLVVLTGNFSSDWSEGELRRELQQAGLSFELCAKSGGWIGGDAGWESKPLLVLRKSVAQTRALPQGWWDPTWPEFANYANDAFTPEREKTQSHFLAWKFALSPGAEIRLGHQGK